MVPCGDGRAGSRARTPPRSPLRLVERRLFYYDQQARMLAGVDRVRPTARSVGNGGLAVSGQGDFSVLVIDSGVDATHEDLKLAAPSSRTCRSLTSTNLVGDGFTPLVTLENVPNTDQSVGHGTHCAGIIAGSGQRSGGKYAGVAPGAKLIGAGLGAGLFVLNAVGAWEWALANQFNYNIRVVSNSYGSFDRFDPDNPIHVREQEATQRRRRRLRGLELRPRQDTSTPTRRPRG